MAYGEYKFDKLKNYPKELDAIGLTPVYFPRQDGLIEHYALLDKDKNEIVSTQEPPILVKEANKKIEKFMLANSKK